MSRTVSPRDLPGTPELFGDYLDAAGPLTPFFGRDFRSPEAMLEVRAPAHGDRAALAAALAKGNALLDADEAARRSVEALREEDTRVVIAGQQPGPYGGFLYALYKAVSVVALARDLEARSPGSRFVPLFWNASEDHDLDEMNQLHLLEGIELRKLALEVDVPPGTTAFATPVGRAGEDLAARIRELLPETDFRDAVLERLGPRPDDSLGSWSARAMLALLGGTGLAIVDPHWIRELSRPVYDRAIRDHEAIRERFDEATARVRDLGYSPALEPKERLRMFLLENGRRKRIVPEGDRFAIEGSGPVERKALLSRLGDDPGAFSSDVVTRPLVQASVLPVAAFVAGPSEIAYHAQLGGVFELFELPMPVLLPRASMTLIPKRRDEDRRRFGLSDRDLFDRTAEPPLDREVPRDVAGPLESLERLVDATIDDLAREAPRIESGLEATVERHGAELRARVAKLRKAIEDAHDRARGVGRERWERLRAEVLPGGRLQERTLGPLPFLTRFGPDLARDLAGIVDPFDPGHRILPLPLEQDAERQVVRSRAASSPEGRG